MVVHRLSLLILWVEENRVPLVCGFFQVTMLFAN